MGDVQLAAGVGRQAVAAGVVGEPEPNTVASFRATWKSRVQGRSAAVTVFRAESRTAWLFQSKPSGKMRSSGAFSPRV
jgi:hypothetical protein